MQSAVVWSDQVPNRNDRDRAVWDICFNPDGTQMIVAVTNRVLVYDAVDADLLQSLRGHKGTVFTVAYSSNGKFFASGGADNTIIIWNSDAEGQLKCVAHTQSLAPNVFCVFSSSSPKRPSRHLNLEPAPLTGTCCKILLFRFLAIIIWAGITITIPSKSSRTTR